MVRAGRNWAVELLEATAKLPWWGGIVLAFLAFIMLHPFAIMDVAYSMPVDDYVPLTSKAFWRGLADTGQYLVPAVLVVAPFVAALVHRLFKGPAA